MATPSIAQAVNRTTVATALRQARIEAAEHRAWINAINRAALNLEACWWSFDGDDLLIESATDSSLRYTVDAHGCECKASKKGSPCWHRAARRLLVKAGEMQVRTLAEVQAAADEMFG